MTRSSVHQWTVCFIALLLATSSAEKQTRWSRQISSYTSDLGEWVPLPGPIDRADELPQIRRNAQSVAEPRILAEPFPGLPQEGGFNQEAFPSRALFQSPSNKQLFLQSMPTVPLAPQNFLTDSGFGHSIRFGLAQPNFPLSQGFIAPQFPFDGQVKARPQPHNNPIQFETTPKASLPLSPQAKPFVSPTQKTKPDTPKFVDGYRLENASSNFAFDNKKRPQSLQKLKFENYNRSPVPLAGPKQETSQNKPKVEREEVQLLYVPVESLNRGQFNFKAPSIAPQPQLLNANLFSQTVPRPDQIAKQSFTSDFQRPFGQNYNFGQNYFSNFNSQFKDVNQAPKFSTFVSPFPTLPPTTPKPKKLKPHQPPLAVFLVHDTKKSDQIKVGDVLTSLKNAKTIAVLDSVSNLNAPKVFIGPASLTPPENFVKFELPYLSNIDNSDRKLRQLPFFVAPLSYNTPDGFAKIPFPSPHVGSVVVNSQIKETVTPSTSYTPSANVSPNAYSVSPPPYRQEKVVTQKPSLIYYSTSPPAPQTTPPTNYHPSTFYSFEPQTVTSFRTQENKAATAIPQGSFFLGNQYNPSQYVKFPSEPQYNTPTAVKTQNVLQQSLPKPTTTTVRPTKPATTTTTTTPSPSTYPSKLLETHNPYSINHAFHLSTPIDYHNFFEEYKESYGNPGLASSSSSSSPSQISSTSPSPKAEENVSERQYQQQSSPNYLQNYSPEIHYETEKQNSRHPVYHPNTYTAEPEITTSYIQKNNQIQTRKPAKTDNTYNTPTNNDYLSQSEIQTPEPSSKYSEEKRQEPPFKPYDMDVKSTQAPHLTDHYETSQYSDEGKESIETTTVTTTTTTKRSPIRNRSRPRYTSPKSESNESTQRPIVTRRPLRERKPLTNRSRPTYEPNKISTERTTKTSSNSNESTTKSYKNRTRGRIQYKQSESDQIYDKPSRTKDNDLAYQRDILHQNYPVTLMERASTHDIEAITEPIPKLSSTKSFESSPVPEDTDNAYTNEKVTVSQQFDETESNEDITVNGKYVSPEVNTEKILQSDSTTRNDDYIYHSRSSLAPVEAISSYGETALEDDNNYSKQTTPVQKSSTPEIISYATEPINAPATEQTIPNYSVNVDHSTDNEEESTTSQNIEITKLSSQESNRQSEETSHEAHSVQTTPSYNRVRLRPGVIRQYHQASSTESSKTKNDRRKAQAVTHRPAFVNRRTTMHIEEIEADLKTKQVHARPEFQDYRQPIYRPEQSTTSSATIPVTDATTKRISIRRRKPYTATSTEASSTTKASYETKNRFRARRPTLKTTEKTMPTEKTEVQTDESTTIRSALFSRYSNTPRLSEKYDKKTEENSEDQDSNFSINRPQFISPESEQWSPKISSDSFKPFNPNDIIESEKSENNQRKLDNEGQLDIITAKNEYDDILLTVTPATNNQFDKKIPEIPPTLEAFVELSKTTKSATDMSTFESMLQEVMKSLEEQDKDEYTNRVQKHKGGEIGEIPPEKVITFGDSFTPKMTTQTQQDVTTAEALVNDSTLTNEEEDTNKNRRRGFWKKVKVRPLNGESIEASESQFYGNILNHLGEPVKTSNTHDKAKNSGKPKVTITTYKPSFDFLKDNMFDTAESVENYEIQHNNKMPKINEANNDNKLTLTTEILKETVSTETYEKELTTEKYNPGDMDLGTGSPDPTGIDSFTTQTEPTTSEKNTIKRSDAFSFMDYLFGVTSSDSDVKKENIIGNKRETTEMNVEITTERFKPKTVTIESTYVPDEITTTTSYNDYELTSTEFADTRTNNTELPKDLATTITTEVRNDSPTEKTVGTSVSSFMDPAKVLSTSMSTEISHETEICFRGKCFKTSRDVNL